MKIIRVAYRENIFSIMFRFFRALWVRLHRPPWANHFCEGESGSGEWSCRSDTPSICGYCKRPNAACKEAK